jgi:MFS family permease
MQSPPNPFHRYSDRSTATNTRPLWLATATNQISVGMQQVILGWIVLELTNSSGMVGLAFALRSAPNLVVGFAAGALTDRLDRRTIMRLAVWTMGVLSLVMAAATWSGYLEVWHVLAYATLIGILRSFEATARQAYVYDLVGTQNALKGIASNAIAQRLGGVLGALVAGAALEWRGASTAFLATGLCYGLGGLMLNTLRHRGLSAPTTLEPLWENVKTYSQALRTNPILLSLMLSTAASEILGFSHQTLLPVLAKDIIQVGAAGLGLLTAFRFVGGLLGAMGLAAWRQSSHQGILLLVVLAWFGLGVAALSQVTQLWLAIACVVGINIMASATDILHQALLQYHVPNTQRGRAIGSWVVGTGAAPIGHLEIGYLAAVTSVSAALMVNGIALMALPLVFWWAIPRLRRL